jgi:hypothetical protein
MRLGMIHYIVFWLNLVPKSDQDYSPKELILGEQKLDYKFLCQLPFGTSVQVHDDLEVTNNMESRTTGAINLGPTGNAQGKHSFLSLKTRETIVRRNWTEIPVPTDVIIRLGELKEESFKAGNSMNNFSEENPLGTDVDEIIDENNEMPDDQENIISSHKGDIIREENFEGENRIIPDEKPDNILIEENGTIQELTTEVGEDIEKSDLTHENNLRLSRVRDYSHKFSFLPVSAELKSWGDDAKKALLDELNLFVKEEVFESVKNPSEMQIKNALCMHCMEEETYSPTVRLESIMLSSLIDAYEKRHVRTINIKGTFLKAKLPDNLDSIVKMEGKSAELMNKICLNFIIEEDGIIYLKFVKALYGHVDMARLFYDDLNKMLVDKMGFKRNQYDPCIYNKETNDGVITAHTHVDDIKISLKSEKQLDIVVNDFIKHYKEITVHKEDSHDYLGMVMSHDIEN